MDIRHCVAELLSLHDCVIIPGFGGFIGNYSPARIDSVHHTFHPPSKKILFNINLRQNDGLLVNAVASAFGVSYQDAVRLVDDFCEEIRCALKSEHPFDLPQIGTLLPGSEGIIHFEQESASNLLADSFGLSSFISPPVIRKTSAFQKNWQHSHPATPQVKKAIAVPRILKWAAIIALPVGIAAVIGVTQYGRITSNWSGKAGILNPDFLKEQPVPSHTSQAARKPVVKVVQSEKTEPQAVTAVESVEEQKIAPEDRYAIIVGAFKSEENARKLISDLELKGVQAAIFDQSKSGLYRVTIGSCSEPAKANKILELAKSIDFSDAWILAK